MANGLITSYFSSNLSSRKVEEQDTLKEDASLGSQGGESGLTVDLGGLMSGVGKKKRRRHKRKGHKHLSKLSSEDNFVSLDEGFQVEDDKRVEEMLIMDPDEDIVLLSPLKQRSATLSAQWQQLFKKKSPIRRAVLSPKRSPRQPTVSRKSPLKQAARRQLLTTPTPTPTKIIDTGVPPIDHAPYTQLVHVQQQAGNYASCSNHFPPSCFTVKATPPALPSSIEGGQSLGLSKPRPNQSTIPSFKPITDISTCFEPLQRDHPSVNISGIYLRYRSLTAKVDHSQGSGNSLFCSIAVKVEGQRISVDRAAYPRPMALHNHMHSDLWSCIYRPRKSSEVIGNSIQCSRICNWLARWKAHGATEKKVKEVPQRTRNRPRQASAWWISHPDTDFVPADRLKCSKGRSSLSQRYLNSDSDAEVDEEDELCPVMVVCGPTGSGKSAAVYACAEELGFGVYEINSSSSRGRSQMLSTLREVTLSHLVAQRKKSRLLCVQDEEDNRPQAISLESNTLILLEEVDVLFGEEERGFWSAVYEVVHSTKRPFVMTCTGSDVAISCPHLKMTFARPPIFELSLHIQLLSLAHGLSLSPQSANQIVESFNMDIRKTFHFMHTWLSWYPRAPQVHSLKTRDETLPQSATCPHPVYPSTCWRSGHCSTLSSKAHQSDLIVAAASADNLATIDILTSPSKNSHPAPWWRAAPTTHLIDELSCAENCNVALQNSNNIATEIARMSGTSPHYQQSCAPSLHSSLKASTEAFSINWRLARISMATEGLPCLRLISCFEEQRRLLCLKRRFHHYLKQSDVSIENLNLLTNSCLV